MLYYKVFEYSVYVVGDDNNPVEIFCGLSKEKAMECARKRFEEIKDGPFCDVFVSEWEMVEDGTRLFNNVLSLNNGQD